MSNRKENNTIKPYNRTFKFARDVIRSLKQLPRDDINKNFVHQLSKSSSSVGANYREATEAESLRDFLHKIRLCKKESKESRFWLGLVLEANSNLQSIVQEGERLAQEAREFTKIFSSAAKTSAEKMKNEK
ncbi:MAG: four helix bundle protein [Candidatus Cloacimonetes bacterium]|nr:four helix bundle protein [Candidatus Cloacimonadota bacterium]